MKVLSIHEVDQSVHVSHGISAREKEVEMNGPPGALVGLLTLDNTTNDPVFIESLQLRSSKAKGPKMVKWPDIVPHAVHIQQLFGAGESRPVRLNVTFPATTEPGDYVFDISIGEQTISARATIQPVLDVELIPSTLFFLGTEPGTVHHASVLFANHGNVPLVVPALRHSTALDMDLVCRNLSKAVRSKGEDGAEATFDEFFRLTRSEMAGWVELSVEEAGTVVAPGGAVTMHITFTMPGEVPKSNVVHDGDVRIYDELLSFVIAPAP